MYFICLSAFARKVTRARANINIGKIVEYDVSVWLPHVLCSYVPISPLLNLLFHARSIYTYTFTCLFGNDTPARDRRPFIQSLVRLEGKVAESQL